MAVAALRRIAIKAMQHDFDCHRGVHRISFGVRTDAPHDNAWKDACPMVGRKSVLIVDDHPAFRSLARQLLEASGFVVAGEAEDGRGAIHAMRNLHPDVVLLDIQLPDIDGFEVARRLMAGGHSCAIVFVSSREATDYGQRLRVSDVAGFIAKDQLSGAALRSVLSLT
jgi:DNA-binding NarL/FixJ family response regulator